MSWNAEMQPSGLFLVSNEVGRDLFDGAFRHDIPASLRFKVLTQIAESPRMLGVLEVVLGEVDLLIQAMVAEGGGGALGQTYARQEAGRLFDMREMINDQIMRAKGLEAVVS